MLSEPLINRHVIPITAIQKNNSTNPEFMWLTSSGVLPTAPMLQHSMYSVRSRGQYYHTNTPFRVPRPTACSPRRPTPSRRQPGGGAATTRRAAPRAAPGARPGAARNTPPP